MRVIIKRILRKHVYPPAKKACADIVLQQAAEVLCRFRVTQGKGSNRPSKYTILLTGSLRAERGKEAAAAQTVR
jgi:hypothetical protein